MSRFTATLQAFFTTYLTGQKAASPHTISAYRDTWRIDRKSTRLNSSH